MRTYIDLSSELQQPLWPSVERWVGDPAGWLPSPAHPLNGETWRVTVHAGPIKRVVDVRVGSPWALTDAWERTLHWEPEGRSGLLPEFDGRLVLREHGRDAPTLELHGHYIPPGGALGSRADALVGHNVAEATCRAFLESIAARLASAAESSEAADQTRQRR